MLLFFYCYIFGHTANIAFWRTRLGSLTATRIKTIFVSAVYEIPFSSESKFQLSVHKLEACPKQLLPTFKSLTRMPEDSKMLLVMKGAPEKILERCTTVRLGDKDVSVRGHF